jgi:predicted membrane protein
VLFFTTIAKFFSITTTNFINDVFHISEYTDIIELVFIIILGVLAVFFALGYSSYDAREKQKFSWANTVKYAILCLSLDLYHLF